MIWLLVLSVFAFVMIGNNLLSKGNALRAAERSFDRGDYVESYGELAGVKLGESDAQLYERAKVLAGVQTELDSYYSMMGRDNPAECACIRDNGAADGSV